MQNWFIHCRTLDEARDEYRRLCFEHHPDHGGDTLVMQAINVAYERFKLERTAPELIRATPRSTWQRPPRQRPTDVPPQYHAEPPHQPEPSVSRDYLSGLWQHAPWQQLQNGGVVRYLLGHTVALVQHPSPKYTGAWFVVLNDTISPLVHESRVEAEQAAFEVLYEKVKYLDL